MKDNYAKPSSIDWARIADLYDSYVRTDLDIPFFLAEAHKASGRILELMSGTGRVSIPLIEAGLDLTCVDASAEMLTILRAKLAARNLDAPVYQMDVRALDLDQRFDLIFIPFHSFAELLTTSDQRETLAGVRRHLKNAGRFVCTLHNPRVRLQRVDGQLRLWGNSPLENQAGTLLFWGLENHDTDSHVVHGLELFEQYDARGVMETKRMVALHYRVVEKNEFEAMVAAAGFESEALYGDYARSEFREDISPFMIWVLRKP
jgi:SAM-dependent methyltransferase